MRKFLVSVFLAGSLVALLVGPQLALAQSYSSRGGGSFVAANPDTQNLAPAQPVNFNISGVAGIGIVRANTYQAQAGNSTIVFNTNGVNSFADLLHVDNNSGTKLSLGPTGVVTLGAPLPQASGGSGAGALTCPAGQFLTSNGTAYSCSAPANASVVVAHVSAAGVVGQQFGSITLSNPAHTSGQGSYNFVITGATPGSIVFVSANSRIGNNPNGTFIEATPTTNQVLVECSNAAGGAADCDFSLDIRKL